MATTAATKPEKKVQFQEVPDEDDDASSVSTISETRELGSAATGVPAEASAKHVNRNEKKARKILGRLGLKPVPNVTRVTMRRGKVIFAIEQPEVYRIPGSDQYVVFGEAKVQDPAWHAHAAAAQQQAATQHAAAMQQRQQQSSNEPGAVYQHDSDEDEKDAKDEQVDATGIDEKDIMMVMDQANVGRSKAIKALRKHDNDIVNTIMELTM